MFYFGVYTVSTSSSVIGDSYLVFQYDLSFALLVWNSYSHENMCLFAMSPFPTCFVQRRLSLHVIVRIARNVRRNTERGGCVV